MKKLLLGGGVVAALLAAVTLSQSRSPSGGTAADPNALQIEAADKNPWTNLKVNADPERFQFAVVSDRTGGHREKVFSRAVHQVNLLQPEFVMSVGDLIEGYTVKEEVIAGQWDQFDAFVKKFEMPFFYVPGNHDRSNAVMAAKWGERYGKRYYHFVYKNALFLCLCSDNPEATGLATIDPEQQEWVRKTLAANAGVRWTFVFLHQPIWAYKDPEKNGWIGVEKALAGRKYTVFCGHMHRYQVYNRNGMRYFQLATTGGGSRMRGVEYGEFDQIAWVTVRKDTPLIANVLLDGVLPADLETKDTEEAGVKENRQPTHPAAVTVRLDGQPLAAATVTLHRLNPETEKWASWADGLTDDRGETKLSTYTKFDGVPVGKYAVTVVKTGKGYYDGEVPEKSLLPARYETPAGTPLKVTVKPGSNEFILELTGK
ncbi:MAG: metallophosphoesterase [Gemmataceae bacterium]|nr:metallophosphoesterase [Gemmataceae bacterium]